MIRPVLRIVSWGILFVPWGIIGALVTPHQSMVLWQWSLLGGLLSLFLFASIVTLTFFIPCNVKSNRFTRKGLGFGSISVVSGALLPTLILYAYGEPLFPWAHIIVSSSFLSGILLFLLEFFQWCVVEVNPSGIMVSSPGGVQSALYCEIVPDSHSDNDLDFVFLSRGRFIPVGGGLIRGHRSCTLGRVLFAPFFVDNRFPFGDSIVLKRFLSIKSMANIGTISDEVLFLLDAIGSKSSLVSVKNFVCFAPAIFFPVSFISLGMTNGYLLLASVLSVLVGASCICRERERLFFLAGNPQDRFYGPWLSRSLSRIQAIRFVFVGAMVVIAFVKPAVLPFIARSLSLSSMVLPCVFVITGVYIVYFFMEHAIDRALAAGSVEVALRLIESKVKNENSSYMSARRAYGLAVNGTSLDLALKLAHLELSRMISMDSILYCTLAVARSYQLQGKVEEAKLVASKFLLHYSNIKSAKGIRGRLCFEAETILSV